MHNIVLRKKAENFGDFDDQVLQVVRIFTHFEIRCLVPDEIATVLIGVILIQIVEVATKRSITQFIDNPCVELLNFVVIHYEHIVDATVLLVLWSWLTVQKKEVTEPNLFEVSLVFVGCQDLFNSIKLFAFLMETKPDEGKSTSAEKLIFFKSCRKSHIVMLQLFILQFLVVFRRSLIPFLL